LASLGEREVVSIDGNSAWRSHDSANGRAALQTASEAGGFDEFVEQAELPEHISYAKSVDTDHGRTEIRHCWTTGDIEWLESRSAWKLYSICVVKSEHTRYFISSLEPDEHRLAQGVRSHWAIENSLHWVLDIAFREDECRKRKDHSVQTFSILRHLTLNMLKRETTYQRSIKRKRLQAGWDESYLEKVLKS